MRFTNEKKGFGISLMTLGNLTYISDWTNERLAFLDDYFATNFTLSLAGLQNQNPIKIYPNPAVDRVTIALADHAFPAEASIFSLTGQKVMQQMLMNNNTSLEVGKLISGIYFVTIQSDGLKETKKTDYQKIGNNLCLIAELKTQIAFYFFHFYQVFGFLYSWNGDQSFGQVIKIQIIVNNHKTFFAFAVLGCYFFKSS
ncbi:MAG: hypothetical protein CO119_04805 [Flavobacteriales bacterium CG_4_9_14_3_um_filter_40_17]|nr:MAG: hypothetical protein CO119_04805 [Flavobacteriales bacterium CG_4_9_14_3_um_filter_40_17]